MRQQVRPHGKRGVADPLEPHVSSRCGLKSKSHTLHVGQKEITGDRDCTTELRGGKLGEGRANRSSALITLPHVWGAPSCQQRTY